MSIELPAHLGRYRLTRVRGQGAMGVVYEAEDSRLGRVVAVKTVQRNVLFDESTASDFAERFEREARAAASLSHPNIVTVYDFGEHDGSSYIVMELVRGRELAQSFDAGQRPSLRESVRIVAELLDALDYAHRQGVVHRDIKPANVMLDETGRVKLTDFGVARVATTAQERTMPGTQVGTPSYMAPEQILGTAVGSRADIFAAGVVLYQCLTGQRPFSGGGAFQIQRQIVQDEPRPPSSLVSELPPTMDGVVARALAKRPEDRYQTAAQFATDLRATLGAESTDPGLLAPAEHDPDATIVMRPGAWPPAGLRAAPTGATVGSTGLRSGAGVGPGTAPSATRSTAAGPAPPTTGARAAAFEPTRVAPRPPSIPPTARAAEETAAATSAPGPAAAMPAPAVAPARAKARPKVAALIGAALLVALLAAAAFAWRSWSPSPPAPTR
ncbi:MAG: protein kinase, partial [Rubrivivax sp.]